jgi:hypothetical protein
MLQPQSHKFNERLWGFHVSTQPTIGTIALKKTSCEQCSLYALMFAVQDCSSTKEAQLLYCDMHQLHKFS